MQQVQRKRTQLKLQLTPLETLRTLGFQVTPLLMKLLQQLAMKLLQLLAMKLLQAGVDAGAAGGSDAVEPEAPAAGDAPQAEDSAGGGT